MEMMNFDHGRNRDHRTRQSEREIVPHERAPFKTLVRQAGILRRATRRLEGTADRGSPTQITVSFESGRRQVPMVLQAGAPSKTGEDGSPTQISLSPSNLATFDLVVPHASL